MMTLQNTGVHLATQLTQKLKTILLANNIQKKINLATSEFKQN